MELWLEHYAKVRDTIICELEQSEPYQKFNNSDMSVWAIDPKFRSLPDRNIYNEECNGKTFVSLDLKKANFQALKHVGVIDAPSYEAFIDKYDKSFYIKKSKYTRQVIFGKLNPKRTITVEHWMMSQILGMDHIILRDANATVVAFKSDELIWEVDRVIDSFQLEAIREDVLTKFGFDIRPECFTIEKMRVKNSNGNNVDCYVRRDLNTGEETLKSVSALFYPQIYKHWKGLKPDPRDLKFYFEDQIATFDQPLVFENENNSI